MTCAVLLSPSCLGCVNVGPTGPTGSAGVAPSYYFSVTLRSPTYYTLPATATPIPFNTVLATSADDSYDVSSSTYTVPASGNYRFEWQFGINYQNGRLAGTNTSFILTVDTVPIAASFESLPQTSVGGGYNNAMSFYEGYFQAGSKVSLQGLNTSVTALVRVIAVALGEIDNNFTCESLF